jgi:nucleoside-diphosphate-sugar epimerase
LKLARTGYPLPFGKTGNSRSMVFLDNLVELINTILDQKAKGIFLGGDREPLSTDRLITLIRNEMGAPARLVNVPSLFRKLMKKYKPALFTRLYGSFTVNPAFTNHQLKFVPPFTSEQGIKAMVDWYCQKN